MNDSLNLWWRPDLLGSAFSGQTVDDFLRESQRLRKGAGYPSSGDAYGSLGVSVSDVGPQGAAKLVAQTMKYAHPRDSKHSSFCGPLSWLIVNSRGDQLYSGPTGFLP